LPTRQPHTDDQVFDGAHAYDEYLLSQMNFGPRPPGSKALRATGDYILSELEENGWETETQEFDFRRVPIRNIIGQIGAGQGPLIILGAHYDTRPRSDMDKQDRAAPVPGASDGASGVAVLLELARTLDKSKLKNEVWLAFFDAEDNGGLTACDLLVVEAQRETQACDLTEWTWSVGAEHVAENLTTKPEAVIVVDMVGDADQNLHYEQNSDKPLQETLWGIAAELGYRQWFIPEARWSMTDDHTPFLKRGIRAIDIIDFDYPPWHTTGDTADKVSADSLERVGRVLETWLEGR
jgi:Zn-dependent M28 family amino/carboxypeptidase